MPPRAARTRGAKFSVEDEGSVSRSRSRERDLEANYERHNNLASQAQSQTNGEGGRSIKGRRYSSSEPQSGIHLPPDVVEEDLTASGDEHEGDQFLPQDTIYTTLKPSTPSRAGSSSYGTFSRYVQLNVPPRLARNESIFKLSGMIDDKSGVFEKYRKSEEEMKGMKKKIRQFYEEQNEILDGFAEVDEILDNTQALASTGELAPMIPSKPSAEREEAFNLKVKLAINVNFIVNFFLLGAKIAIVVASSSVSLLASTVDSAMDFLSTMIIFGTSKIIDHKTWKTTFNWPTGKQRMEPMGVVVFAVFMIASFVQVFIESVQRLADPNLQPARIPLIGKLVMVITIFVKLAVWLWCRSIRNSSVEALAQDAENDIVFNFFSLLFPFLGEQFEMRYLDPLGGAILSLYIIIEWTRTLLENVVKLTGKRASPGQHQRVAYLITRFSPLIRGIQHLNVYHTGDSYIVEVDIVLPSSTNLTVAHNIGESCQYGLEQLEGVDRAYVHLDVTVNPLSGHVER